MLTEKKDNREEFADFYTNRSDGTRSSNTQISAQADSKTTSEDKDTDNISDVQKGGGVSYRKWNELERVIKDKQKDLLSFEEWKKEKSQETATQDNLVKATAVSSDLNAKLQKNTQITLASARQTQ